MILARETNLPIKTYRFLPSYNAIAALNCFCFNSKFMGGIPGTSLFLRCVRITKESCVINGDGLISWRKGKDPPILSIPLTRFAKQKVNNKKRPQESILPRGFFQGFKKRWFQDRWFHFRQWKKLFEDHFPMPD